jgi:hypothetical protein
MSSFRTRQLPIIAAVVLLSPMFAFLMAIASLIAAGVPALLTVVVVGAIGWSLFHKMWVRPHPPDPPYLPWSIRNKILNIIFKSEQVRSKSQPDPRNAALSSDFTIA